MSHEPSWGDIYGEGGDSAQAVSSLVLPTSKWNEPKCFAQAKFSVRLGGAPDVALCLYLTGGCSQGGFGLCPSNELL